MSPTEIIERATEEGVLLALLELIEKHTGDEHANA